VSCVQKLSKIARAQPRVAYCTFTHGLIGKFLRTIPDVSDLLEPLEATITGEFIPAITGRSVGELESKLFSLPVRLGGLDLPSPSEVAGFEFNASESDMFALSTQIIQQRCNFDPLHTKDWHPAKRDQSYGLVMSWLCCSLSFSL